MKYILGSFVHQYIYKQKYPSIYVTKETYIQKKKTYRRLYTGGGTNETYQKRPKYDKRDLYMTKETCI